MLNLVPHSSLPLLLGVCLEPDPILITQFISFNQESVTLDSFSTKFASMNWLASCPPDHLFLTMIEKKNKIKKK